MMQSRSVIPLSVLVLALLLALVAARTATPAALGSPTSPLASPVTSPVASAASCPVTRPNGDVPTDIGNPAFDGGYGNEALWINLWMWGEEGVFLPPHDEHIGPDGSFNELKWAWYRYVPGTLEVEGQRLDAPAPPLEAWVSDGYGDIGFQMTGLTFPTAGCWEVTGRVGDHSLTFVALIEPATAADMAPTTGLYGPVRLLRASGLRT